MENLKKAVTEIQELLENRTNEIQSLRDTIEELNQQLQKLKAPKNTATATTETDTEPISARKKILWFF
jgi:phage shock protein A